MATTNKKTVATKVPGFIRPPFTGIRRQTGPPQIEAFRVLLPEPKPENIPLLQANPSLGCRLKLINFPKISRQSRSGQCGSKIMRQKKRGGKQT
jgi:hypothetical protein